MNGNMYKSILIKFPTRERNEKFRKVIRMYSDMATTDNLFFLISIDEDDPQKEGYLTIPLGIRHPYEIKVGNSKTKVEAINSDVQECALKWDILVLASDDMIPVKKGWDEIIINDMKMNHPDLDGVLYYYDGYQDLNTMPIMGKKYFQRDNYIYNPNFISLWADNYFEDQANKRGKQTKFNKNIILFRHEHWSNSKEYEKTIDDLMRRNERYFFQDERTYRHLKGLMTIDYAIVSSDYSDYINYWPEVKDAWKKLGIKTLLIKIQNQQHNYDYYETENGFIVNLKLIDGVKSSLQAQIARIWIFKFISLILPNDTINCITSDMDMMPLSRKYFMDSMKPYRDDQIISYCSDAAPLFDGYYPMCYILANTKIMASLIKHETWEEFVKDLSTKGGQGWSTDQWHITTLIDQYDKYDNVIKLKRGWNSAGCAFNRLDRTSWEYKDDDIKENKIYDAHLLRPCNIFENKRLLKLITLVI